MKSLFLLVVFLFLGCSEDHKNIDGLKIEDFQGQFVSTPKIVDYSLPETKMRQNLLKSDLESFEAKDCEDIDWGSDYPTPDMKGFVTLHLEITGKRFKKYTQIDLIDLLKPTQLAGKICEQAPVEGRVEERQGRLYLIVEFGDGDNYEALSISKGLGVEIIIQEI